MAEIDAEEISGVTSGFDQSGLPSWVPGTEERSYAHYIVAQGPVKVEYVLFQQAAADDFPTDDTFNSALAHPLFAEVTPTSDIAGTAFTGSVEVNTDETSATFKQVILRDIEDLNGLGVLVKVYGY